MTGDIDSFTISGYQNKVKLGSQEDVDELSLTILDVNTTANYTDTYTWRLTLGTSSVAFYIDDPKMGNNGYTGKVFSYPFKQDFMETVTNGDLIAYSKLVKIYPSFTVNGISYSNVAQVNLHTSGNVPGTYTQDDFFYICPDNGIIKMNIDHPVAGLKKKLGAYQVQNCAVTPDS